MKCNQCEAAMINGVYCHETGCPDSWRYVAKECKWCGLEFMPENGNQECCDQDCANQLNGVYGL